MTEGNMNERVRDNEPLFGGRVGAHTSFSSESGGQNRNKKSEPETGVRAL